MFSSPGTDGSRTSSCKGEVGLSGFYTAMGFKLHDLHVAVLSACAPLDKSPNGCRTVTRVGIRRGATKPSAYREFPYLYLHSNLASQTTGIFMVTTPPIPQPGGPPSPIPPTPPPAPVNVPPTDIPPAGVPETPPQAPKA